MLFGFPLRWAGAKVPPAGLRAGGFASHSALLFPSLLLFVSLEMVAMSGTSLLDLLRARSSSLLVAAHSRH